MIRFRPLWDLAVKHQGSTKTATVEHYPNRQIMSELPQGKKSTAKHKEMDAYDRNNYWAKIVGKIGNNQKLTLNYFGDRADDIMFPRYPMDALKDDTDMFKAEYQLFNASPLSEELKMKGTIQK